MSLSGAIASSSHRGSYSAPPRRFSTPTKKNSLCETSKVQEKNTKRYKLIAEKLIN